MSGDQSLHGIWAKLSEVAVKGAQYNSRERQPHPKCLQGTRVDLLKYIHGFLDDTEKNQLVWLHGTAGVGKSAVAFTVAERMRSLKVVEETNVEKRLAGTFFFSRKHTKRCTAGYFFTTLVYQLATNFPSIRNDVNKTIRDNPALLDPDTPLCDQMEALFLQPLRRLRPRLRGGLPLLFVVDALDECTSEPELIDLILSLARALRQPDLPMTHILLTSRSEPHICKAFQNGEVRPLVCEIPVKTSGEGPATIISLDGADVDSDIYIFLEHSFGELQYRHPDFPQPSGGDLAKLASRAGRRFIVASTMMKFIVDDGYKDPGDRLQLMLELTSELLAGTEVYKLYDRILSTCADPKRAYLHLSIVAALADPLPLSQISKLLGPGQGHDAEATLVQLRSVMDIPTDTSLPVNVYHSSIRDYVSDPSNCSLPEVHDMPSPHSLLADSSLRLMMKELPESTDLLDALLELKKESQAMQPEDPNKLKDSLAFLVQPPEPLSVLSGILWLRGDRTSDLQFWLGTEDGCAWLGTGDGNAWLGTEDGSAWLGTEGGSAWLGIKGGSAWLETNNGSAWLHTKGGKEWRETQTGRHWLRTEAGLHWNGCWMPDLRSVSEYSSFPCSNCNSVIRGMLAIEPVVLEARSWLGIGRARYWLQTRLGRGWLQNQRGRDWLQTQGGRDWLQTQGGRDWLQTQGGQDWLQTQGGRDWLQTQGGQDWLQTQEGQYWLQTQEGRDWLQTQRARHWLQTRRGRDWLQTQRGRDWLQTRGGRGWLQTQGGRDWLQTQEAHNWLQTREGRDCLQTQGAHNWLQTQGGRDWLQIQGGRDWLQTQGAHDWLQTQGGRDWLQTQGGRDWLQTPHGQAWQFSPAASFWVTMEEFSSTLEAISEYNIVPELPLPLAFQVIQQFKTLPDFLMLPALMALNHQHYSVSASSTYRLPNKEIVHAMIAFTTFTHKAQQKIQLSSDALKYACQTWTIHLSCAPNPWDDTLNRKFHAFWNRNLLSWLEQQWCLKGLRSCLDILSEGQKLAKLVLPCSSVNPSTCSPMKGGNESSGRKFFPVS